MAKVVDILKKIGAVITDDHFVYTSGKHGSVYINKDALYPHTKETSEVCLSMAEMFKDKEVEAVVVQVAVAELFPHPLHLPGHQHGHCQMVIMAGIRSLILLMA